MGIGVAHLTETLDLRDLAKIRFEGNWPDLMVSVQNRTKTTVSSSGDPRTQGLSQFCRGRDRVSHQLGNVSVAQLNVLYLYNEVAMLAIRLPQSIEKRLDKLARRTGRTKTFYVREAILEHLEDIEDLYLAEGVLERIRSGEEQTIPLKKAMKRHGLQR